jgi:hypothetical protein
VANYCGILLGTLRARWRAVVRCQSRHHRAASLSNTLHSMRTYRSGNARGAEEAAILIHIQRDAAYGIGVQDLIAQVVDEAQTRGDERCCAGKLAAA